MIPLKKIEKGMIRFIIAYFFMGKEQVFSFALKFRGCALSLLSTRTFFFGFTVF